MDSKYAMPNDENVEKAVLGAMLFDKDGLECGLGCLSTADFFFFNNQTIFQAMSDISNSGENVDYVTVSARLQGKVKATYIVELFTNTATSVGIKSYCNILLDLSFRRRAITKAQEILEAAGKNEIDKISTAVEELKNDNAGAVDIEAVPNILESALLDIAELRKSGKRIAGYSTGIYDLDELISGLEKRKLIVIAGRPAMGKSSATLNICQYIAKTNPEENVIFFSLEMPKKDVALKLYSSALDISNEHFKFNMLTAEELLKISQYTEKFSEETKNFYIEDDMNMSVYDIQKCCRNIKNKTGKNFALIAIDYLQIIKIAQNGNRASDLGEASRVSVMLAKEFDCPVVLLSQVNRVCESRQNKRPMLSDLRESGNIEQDADTVIFIYRDEVYNANSNDKGMAEFIVAKQRNGAIGTIKTKFDKKTTTFRRAYKG